MTAFAMSGAKAACIDLDLPTAQSACTQIQQTVSQHLLQANPSASHTPHLTAYACDVTSEPAVQRTFNSILKDLGSIDVLVTAAGIVDNVAAEEYGYERWKRMLDVNLNGTFLCAREVGRWMLKARRGGSIVLVGSMSGFICVRPQKQAAYNAVSASSGSLRVLEIYKLVRKFRDKAGTPFAAL
ncbi:MAG: hypothetical protein M1839_008903 [Geoglossum umbratile]|nr:MAG: hypothetical protein M1839_008903 [Geoglossum umbratile]